MATTSPDTDAVLARVDQHDEVVLAYLFGSTARGESRPRDVDQPGRDWQPTMVDRPRVLDLLASGEAYLADVRRFRDEVGRERFLAERGEQYRIQFPLQQAIQVCIDLAAHLVAETAGRRPDTLAALFLVLADRRVVDRDLAVRLGAMARLRTLLVHEYADVDPTRVWEIVAGHLEDVDAFLGVVARQVGSD